ncbi:glycosyltransferase [Sinomicrobium pectinilyticum]|uniref:Glycosyltransferase n=1 Tax=Sinomicrobium pectinilyticum TaxID=1084421 RepID=A0A3N0E714_SINP1|nr:glycosyltransferase family 4 protein [Sinomicrobium pectinilyticum]RNL83560.1 glycosyltransferase [Sinomicrobium pectinilyticum]
MKNKILIIGPFPEPTTGVSLANKVLADALKDNAEYDLEVINTSLLNYDEKLGSFSIRKILFYFKFNFSLHSVIKSKIIYITPGQTFFGVAKYSLFILLSYFLGKTIIFHIHGNYLAEQYRYLKGVKKRYFYYLMSRGTKGIVLSESLIDNLTPFLNRDKVYILYNFAEDYLWNEIKPSDNDKLRIIFLSNLIIEKGILDLLEALQKLEDDKIPYEAKIAGNIDADNRDLILSKIETLRCTRYVGVVFGKDKKELLEWGNIFVLPTYYSMEGQPISIIEAMATGNIIITTRHAGIPDIVKDGVNGFFIEKKNSTGIFEKIVSVDRDKSMIIRMSKLNQEYFRERFTLSHFQQNFIKILED